MDRGADCYRRFLAGDDSGLTEIIRLYNEGLTLYLYSFVNDLTAADELSEDVFVKLGVKKPRFSGNSSFKTWLYAIGRNAAIDALRKAARHPGVPLDACGELEDRETVERSFRREERKILLHRAMRCLKPEYRQVLWLGYFEDMSAREIAAVLHRSVHSVENLMSRARRALRSELEKEGFTDERS